MKPDINMKMYICRPKVWDMSGANLKGLELQRMP